MEIEITKENLDTIMLALRYAASETGAAPYHELYDLLNKDGLYSDDICRS